MSLSFAEFKVEFLRGLADNTRLKIIESLKGRERTVSQLVKEIGGSQSNISTHLKLLKSTDIVKSRNEGKYVYYSLRDDTIYEFLSKLEDMLLLMRRKALEGV
ncbi:MAG: ArsR/SmtB family transcription factor [Tepidanaerobacteraceae bacterium]